MLFWDSWVFVVCQWGCRPMAISSVYARLQTSDGCGSTCTAKAMITASSAHTLMGTFNPALNAMSGKSSIHEFCGISWQLYPVWTCVKIAFLMTRRSSYFSARKSFRMLLVLLFVCSELTVMRFLRQTNCAGKAFATRKVGLCWRISRVQQAVQILRLDLRFLPVLKAIP